jgi:hypothetical protein
VPDEEAGCCPRSEGNGVSAGKGGCEGRPGPPEIRKDKQSVPNKDRTTWERTRRTSQVGRNEGGSGLTE